MSDDTAAYCSQSVHDHHDLDECRPNACLCGGLQGDKGDGELYSQDTPVAKVRLLYA